MFTRSATIVFCAALAASASHADPTGAAVGRGVYRSGAGGAGSEKGTVTAGRDGYTVEYGGTRESFNSREMALEAMRHAERNGVSFTPAEKAKLGLK